MAAGCGAGGGTDRAVARMTASATSSRLGGAGDCASRPRAPRAVDAVGVDGRSPSGRRLTTTLLAKRLSYSATLLLVCQGIDGRRSGILIEQRRSRVGWVDERLLTTAFVEHSEPILVVAEPIWAGRQRLVHRAGRRSSSRLRPAGEHDDGQDAQRQCHHQPGLRAARQHAARGRAVIGDDRCAGGRFGHGSTALAGTRSVPCPAPGSRDRAPSARRRCRAAPGSSPAPARRPSPRRARAARGRRL